jgi:hypothetical protein
MPGDGCGQRTGVLWAAVDNRRSGADWTFLPRIVHSVVPRLCMKDRDARDHPRAWLLMRLVSSLTWV